MDSKRRRLTILVSIAFGAFALRAMWLLRQGEPWAMTPDSIGYLALAQGLIHRCGFAVWTRGTCGPPEMLRTPGYPAFIAFLGGNWRAVILTQAILGGVLVLALGLFALRYFGFRAALVAAVLIATDVPSILASKSLMSEPAFQFVLAIGVLLLVSAALSKEKRHGLTKAACGGLLVAAASLIRPVGELLAPFLWLPFALSTSQPARQRIYLSVTAVTISAGILLCWAVRNYSVAQTWTLSTDGAFAAYYYATPPLLREDGHESIDTIRHELVSRIQPKFETSAAEFPGSIGDPDYDSLLVALENKPSLGASLYDVFAHAARNHPLKETTICTMGLLRLAFQPYSPGIGLRGLMRGESAASTLAVPSDRRIAFNLTVFVTIAFQTIWLIFAWLGALMALVRTWRRWRSSYSAVVTALWAFTILLLVAPTPFFGMRDLRYRTPVMPFLALLAGIGWFSGSEFFSSSKREIISDFHDQARLGGSADPMWVAGKRE